MRQLFLLTILGALLFSGCTNSGAFLAANQTIVNLQEADYGEVENGTLALTNVRYDSDILNLILYTQVKVTVRADIVEFD